MSPRLEGYQNPTSRQLFGADVETWVRDQLRDQGYNVELETDWQAPYDLDMAGMPVEVKAAKRRQRQVRPGYYSDEYRWNVGNLEDGDYLLALVAEDDKGQRYLFLALSWAAYGRQGISITSHPDKYSGRLAGYLGNYTIIDELKERRNV